MAKTTEWGNPATKTAARESIKRIRENLRDIEAALKSGDWDAVEQMALDTVGAATEINVIAEANQS